MNSYRRNDFKSWFADVGFLYVIVVLLVTLCFLGVGLKARLSRTVLVSQTLTAAQSVPLVERADARL